jgi:ribosomal protein L29
MATANDLREMKSEELARMLTEQREGLFNLKLKLRTGHLENTASLGAARRDIARLATVLREADLKLVRHAKSAAATKAPKGAKAEKPKAKPSKKKTSKGSDE